MRLDNTDPKTGLNLALSGPHGGAVHSQRVKTRNRLRPLVKGPWRQDEMAGWTLLGNTDPKRGSIDSWPPAYYVRSSQYIAASKWKTGTA